jgi:hypothetical protein
MVYLNQILAAQVGPKERRTRSTQLAERFGSASIRHLSKRRVLTFKRKALVTAIISPRPALLQDTALKLLQKRNRRHRP